MQKRSNKVQMSVSPMFPLFFFSVFLSCFLHFYFLASEQTMVTGVVPSPSRFLPSIFIAYRVQQSHCLSIFHGVLLIHALALFTSLFMYKKKPSPIYTSIHSAGLEPTKLTYVTGSRISWYTTGATRLFLVGYGSSQQLTLICRGMLRVQGSQILEDYGLASNECTPTPPVVTYTRSPLTKTFISGACHSGTVALPFLLISWHKGLFAV